MISIMLARVVTIAGYCLIGSYVLRSVLRMIQGELMWGGIVLAISIVALVIWWRSRRVIAWGKIMLQATVKGYEPESARKLVAQMSEADRKDFAASTELLYLALMEGNTRGAELLLELGMDVNAHLPAYFSETTVLQTFCLGPEPHMEAIRFLLAHGAKADAGQAFPPMIDALAWGNEELVQLLLQHGATPGGMGSEINPSGNTPLHTVCSGRDSKEGNLRLERIKALLQAGADVNALTTAGHTPLDVAMEQKGDEEKPLDADNDALPIQEEVLSLLREHGALRGCQLRCPRPHFCARVLLANQLPDAALLRDFCKAEPTAQVHAVNHAWRGEGLGGLVDEAAMSDEEKRAALAHTCYVEIALEEQGTVPSELAYRFARLIGSVSKAEGCVGVDFGRTVFSAAYAPGLEEAPEAVLCLLVQGREVAQEQGECLMTEGLEELGFLEVRYMDDRKGMSVGVVQQLVLPMLLEMGACLEHGHRAFIAPDFSLVATCEPLGPGGQVVLCLRPDRTHYRD